jgi:hypothetical protein
MAAMGKPKFGLDRRFFKQNAGYAGLRRRQQGNVSMVNIHDLRQRKTPAERGSAGAGNLIRRAERLAAHCYSSITAAS